MAATRRRGILAAMNALAAHHQAGGVEGPFGRKDPWRSPAPWRRKSFSAPWRRGRHGGDPAPRHPGGDERARCAPLGRRRRGTFRKKGSLALPGALAAKILLGALAARASWRRPGAAASWRR